MSQKIGGIRKAGKKGPGKIGKNDQDKERHNKTKICHMLSLPTYCNPTKSAFLLAL